MTLTILIVSEDFEHHTAHLRELLERDGHTVLRSAPDCSSALELLWQEAPDLAFVDTHLGSTTCEIVLDECDQQNIPVIVTSESLPGPEFALGRPILAKPVERDAVKEVLSQRSAA